MDLNFEIFMVVLLAFAILVVGNFLRDKECNYLEGALLIVSAVNPGPSRLFSFLPSSSFFHMLFVCFWIRC